ncbi:MAG: hypothetical protein ACYSTS_19585 [Planctomycetota bacterium]|jgi:hypothetical protein
MQRKLKAVTVLSWRQMKPENGQVFPSLNPPKKVALCADKALISLAIPSDKL